MNYEGCPISNLVRYEEIHLEIGNFAYVLSDISVLDVQHFDIFRYIVFQQYCINLYNPFSKKTQAMLICTVFMFFGMLQDTPLKAVKFIGKYPDFAYQIQRCYWALRQNLEIFQLSLRSSGAYPVTYPKT